MKIKYSYSIGLVGATINDSLIVDKSDFEDMTQEEMEREINEMVWEQISQEVDWNWEIDDEE